MSFLRPHSAHYHQPTQPDFHAAFDFDQDSDDDDDDSHPAIYNHQSAQGTTQSTHSTVSPFAHPLSDSLLSSSPPPPPVASSSASSHHRAEARTSLPGGYDFEPQQDPTPAPPPSGAAPPVALHSRPALLSSPSRTSLSSRQPRAPFTAGADDDLYGRVGRAQPADGLLGGLRGLVGRLRGAPLPSSAGGAHADRAESSGLLFSQDDTDADETDRETAYPPSRAQGQGQGQGQGARDIHLPLPPRPPQFSAPPAPSAGAARGAGGRVFGGGQGNDGVFANLSAKPDNPGGLDVVGEGPDKDEVLPSYDAANLDSTPPYWETTVIAPGGPFSADDIVVDGLPVGNFFSFAWNLLVSMSFQFVGFLLTYLLHTTHAAKNGSRAGLGITLIQLGFYLKQRTDGLDASGDETGLNGAPGPDTQRWSWWGGSVDPSATDTAASATATALGALPTQVGALLSGALDNSDPDAVKVPTLMGDGPGEDELLQMGAQANEWVAFMMVTVGSFLLVGGCLSYWRAVRWARAVRQGQGPGADAENMISV
ncbi:hypothetical protein JCM10207_002235 [Rhodosporidiobolus poonsookiae]